MKINDIFNPNIVSCLPLKVKKIHSDAKLPTKAYSNDAGLDVYSIEKVRLHPYGGLYEVRTGLELEVPVGYCIKIMSRSSFEKKGIVVYPGLWDCGYRNELTILMRYSNPRVPGPSGIDINKGDKIAQLLLLPVFNVDVIECETLSNSARGEKGFGSSGK